MGGSVLECVGEQALFLKDGDRLFSAFNKPNDLYMAQQMYMNTIQAFLNEPDCDLYKNWPSRVIFNGGGGGGGG